MLNLRLFWIWFTSQVLEGNRAKFKKMRLTEDELNTLGALRRESVQTSMNTNVSEWAEVDGRDASAEITYFDPIWPLSQIQKSRKLSM